MGNAGESRVAIPLDLREVKSRQGSGAWNGCSRRRCRPAAGDGGFGLTAVAGAGGLPNADIS